MPSLWKESFQKALAAEILLYELQGSRLAKTHGLQGKTCIYCGAVAFERDHVLPFSLVRKSIGHKRCYKPNIEGPIVDSCCQCNRFLSNRIFKTFKNRLKFIYSKYRELELKSNEPSYIWDAEELEELGPELKQYVNTQIVMDKIIKAKIWWIETLLKTQHKKKFNYQKDIMEQQQKPRQCRTCKDSFQPRRFWQKFCSEKCRQRWHGKERQRILTAYRRNLGKS